MKPTRPNTDIPAWLQTTTTTPTPAIKAKFWQRNQRHLRQLLSRLAVSYTHLTLPTILLV